MTEVMGNVDRLYSYFGLIEIISLLDMAFFVEHICTWGFTKKIGRSYSFPQHLHFTDLIMVLCSINVLQKIRNGIYRDINDQQSDSDRQKQLITNLILNDDSSFVYFFSISIGCLFIRLASLLQFNDSVGPLIKIVGKA